MQNEETKMWSYKLSHDAMMAPNPLWGILTLATCKPVIRKSKKTVPGTWIAGFTACTVHNSALTNEKITHCKPDNEKLIYLAKVKEVLPLEEYWVKYPQKRPVATDDIHDARFYGDNYYYKEENEMKVAPNNQHYEEGKVRDLSGKNAIVCEEFYYFTPENRLSVVTYENLVHKVQGQALKKGKDVDDFISYVRKCAHKMNVKNGIIGNIDVKYDCKDCTSTPVENPRKTKKGGCGR